MKFKIHRGTKEISNQIEKIVMIVRHSMQTDLERIIGTKGGNLSY